MQYRWVRVGTLLCLCSGVLGTAGCNGGNGASSTDMLRNRQDVVIAGFLTDGPIIGATVEVISADDAIMSQALVGSTASFHALVPANTKYPIRLRALGGIDLVTQRTPDFVLETVITRPDQAVANLSPFSTLVSRVVACSTKHAKVAQVWDRVMGELGMGYDVERFGHPSWTPMESANAVPFVLASEALGESVRRTRDALGDTADEVDADAVISALGCDLAADRVLDGRGDGSSPRISATFHAASAGVLVETVTRRLRVDDADAAQRLDAAIREVRPEGGSVLDVEPNPLVMQQTRDHLTALLGRVPGDLIPRLMRLFDQTPAAQLRTVIAASLSADDDAALADSVRAVANADAQAIDAILASVAAPVTVAPAVSLAAAPAEVGAGQTTRLSWAAADAKACWASGAWAGERSVEGTYTTSPLTLPTRYGLTCTGSGGTASQEVSVIVPGVPPPAAPRVELSATPATVSPGESVTLAWTSSDSTACTADGNWSGTRPSQGREILGPLSAGQSYSLACVGPGGAGSDFVSIDVRIPPPAPVAVTSSIQASPAWLARGAATTLSWSSKGATQCVASGAWSGARPVVGTATVTPTTIDSTFVLSCSGAGGNAVSSIQVSLRAARLAWRATDEQISVGEIAGFRIFHGTAPGSYGAPIPVSDSSARELEMELPPGTHYFAVAPMTASGSVGPISNEVSKVVH